MLDEIQKIQREFSNLSDERFMQTFGMGNQKKNQNINFKVELEKAIARGKIVVIWNNESDEKILKHLIKERRLENIIHVHHDDSFPDANGYIVKDEFMKIAILLEDGVIPKFRKGGDES